MTLSKLISVLFFSTVFTGCAHTQIQEKPSHQFYFDEIKKRLTGEFNEVSDNDGWTVKYTLMSKNTVLNETWLAPNGKTELTLFYMDNGTLLATHYCASGVQSTMELLAPDNLGGKLAFKIRSATNLSSPDQAHNSGFEYLFLDDNRVKRSELWLKSGKESSSVLILHPNKPTEFKYKQNTD